MGGPVLHSPVGQISVVREGGRNVLVMAGEIDVDTVAAYEAEHPENPVISVVDLREVSYLSSTGIGLMLRHTRSAREGGNVPTMRGISRHASRVLRLVGVADLFAPAAGTPVAV